MPAYKAEYLAPRNTCTRFGSHICRMVPGKHSSQPTWTWMGWRPTITFAGRRTAHASVIGYHLRSTVSIRILDVRTGKEEQLTSPVAFSDRETPYGWSTDDRFVIVSSFRHNPGRATIVLVPVSQAPKAEQGAIKVTDSAEFNLWNPSMSPDREWICFNATTPGPQAASTRARGAVGSGQMSKLAVVSSRGGPWIEVTDGTFWDDKPRWSGDGRLLYFFSDRGGLFNVWAVAFDTTMGKPIGDPFPVTRFTGLGEQAPLGIGGLELGVGRGRLAIPVVNPTGGIWMLDNVGR